MPEVHEIVENPFAHGVLDIPGRHRLGADLRSRRYDEAIVLPNSWKSALVPFLAGIPVRTGFTGEARFGLINRRHRLDEAALPMIAERYAQLAEAPGRPLPRPLPDPHLVADPQHCRATLEVLGLAGVPVPVAFCPGAEYGPAKRWPEAHFAELARALSARGHAVWLLGSGKDRPVGEEIARLAPGACTNLCGSTSLGQAVDLIAAASYVVTNDSGLMHVAAALGRPLTALFGSSSPEFTPPLSPLAEVIWLRTECSPCFERECPLGHFRCMKEMTPALVLARIERHLTTLAGKSPEAALRSGHAA